VLHIIRYQHAGRDGVRCAGPSGRNQSAVPGRRHHGLDSQEAYDRALGVGAVAYLRKPVNDQALLDAIAASTAPAGR